jgi:hypothetical protein
MPAFEAAGSTMRTMRTPLLRALAALALAAPLAGALACRRPAPGGPPAPAAGDRPAVSMPAGGTPIGRWRGTLPCTDCPGIDTELELFAGAGGISGPYRLVEVYSGRPAGRDRSETRGEWLAERSAEHDRQATVYRLEPEGGGPARYFLAVGDDLEALDRQARPIASRANLHLRLVEEPPGGATAR